MLRIVNRIVRPLLIAAAFLSVAFAGFAQANSNTATVTMNATLAETIALSVTSGSPTAVTLVKGSTATAATPVVIATSWALASSRSNVSLVGYFTSSTAALAGGGVNIPSNEVFGSLAGGTGSVTSATAFSGAVLQGVGTASASLTLFTQPITSANYSSSRNDTLTLVIDLTNQPQLPAGSYSGTLNLMAVAY